MKIFSSVFRDGERIPRQYSRDGEDKSPPLRITDVPPNTRSLALIMDDPDAPRGTFTHWSRQQIMQAMQSHILEQAETMGRYAA